MGLGLLLLVFVVALLIGVLSVFGITFAFVSWPIYFWPRRVLSYVPLLLLLVYLVYTRGELRFLS